MMKDGRDLEHLLEEYKERCSSLEKQIRNIQSGEYIKDCRIEKLSEIEDVYLNLPLPFQSVDKEGKCLYVNSEWCELLGYSGEEVIGRNILAFIDRKHHSAFEEGFNDFKKKGIVKNAEIDFRHKKGHLITVSLNGNIYYDNNGRMLRTHIVLVDLTARKDIERQLFLTGKKFSKVLNSSDECYLIFNMEGKILETNRSASIRVYGVDSGEWIDKNIMEVDVLDKASMNEVKKNFRSICKGNKPGRKLYRTNKNVPDTGTVEVISYLLENGDDQCILSIIRPYTDIEELKVKNREWKREVEVLRNSLINSIEQCPLGVLITDSNGNMEYINRRFTEICGYMPADVISKNVKILSSGYHPVEYYDRLWDTISTGGIWKGEFYNKRKNGEFYWEESTISAIKDNSGIITNYIAFKEDISDRKVLIENLKSSRDKAEESDRLKTAFLQNVSHEIRTPMNGIMGFAELLEDEEASSEDTAQYLCMLKNSCQRMLGTVNEIIDVSIIESGCVTLKKTCFDLNDEIESLYRRFRIDAVNKGLKFKGSDRLPEEESLIYTDRLKLNTIVSNLLSNAIKFTKEGYVKMACFREERELFIVVADTGTGIDKKDYRNIFDRFIQIGQTALKKNNEGIGLGLSITKSYVELMGGRISIKPNKPSGTVFTVYIPFEPVMDKRHNMN